LAVCSASFDPSKSTFEGTGKTTPGFSNVNRAFTIHLVDANGTPMTSSPGSIVWDVKLVGGPEDIVIIPVDNGDGTFTCEYTATKKGTYSLQVKANGVHLVDSPVANIVIRGPWTPNCTASGAGIAGGVRNEPLTFFITAKDENGDVYAHGNDPFKVEVFESAVQSPPHLIPSTTVGHFNGVYASTYTPRKPGQHSIRITLDGVEISGVPYLPVIINKDKTKTVVIGLGVGGFVTFGLVAFVGRKWYLSRNARGQVSGSKRGSISVSTSVSTVSLSEKPEDSAV
jgi:hypothetical protein